MSSVDPFHNCCDMCLQQCTCGHWPSFSAIIVPLTADNDLLSASVSHELGHVVREVTHVQRKSVKHSLENLRQSLTGGNMFVNAAVITGLTDSVISSITANLHHIHCVEDLMTEHIHDQSMAESVLYTSNLNLHQTD